MLRKRNIELKPLLQPAMNAKRLGFSGYWQNFPQDGTAPWTDIAAAILHEDNKILCLLGANGDETFGSSRSPLFSALEKFEGSIRAILIDPDCDQMKERAEEIGTPVGQYMTNIFTSVERLTFLSRRRGGSQQPIEWCFNPTYPSLKLIITSNSAWVQYYMPHKHVHETPVFRFEKTKEEDDFYRLICLEFDRVWKRCIKPNQTVAEFKKH